MKLCIACAVIFLTVLAPLAAQSATITAVRGKVQVKALTGPWQIAAVGTELSLGSTVSTGFKSEARIDVGDSELIVRPLTRMRLEELVKKEAAQKTSLYLNVGRVSARVKTAEGLQHDFELRSPVSTAAVRGTDFDYDGFALLVREGAVEIFSRLRQRHAAYAGEAAALTAEGFVLTNKSLMDRDTDVAAYAGQQDGIAGTARAEITGGIILTWD
jgi:hypothetical protein